MAHIVDESEFDTEEVQEVETMDLEDASQFLEERKQQAEEARLREEALNSGGMDLSRARPTSHSASRSGATARSSLPPPAHAASRVPSSAGQSGRVSVSAAATAAAALAGVCGDGQGINTKLLELLIEQQKLISGVQAKRAEVPPPPGFQSLAHPQPGTSRPQPVRASSSLLLGAQMGQLALGPERS